MDISPRQLRVTPGISELATVRIRYHGPVVTELALALGGDAAEWARVAPDTVNVNPDTEIEATLRLDIPRAPYPRAGLLELELEVTSSGDLDAETVLERSIEVAPFDELDVQPVGSTQLTAQREAALAIKIRNRGNREARIRLQVPEAVGLNVSLSLTDLVLEPGADSTVWVGVRPSHGLSFGAPHVYPFTVVVNGDRTPAATISAQLSQLPRYGRIKVGFATLLAVVATAAAGALAIAYFNDRGRAENTPTPTASGPTAPPSFSTPTPTAQVTGSSEASTAPPSVTPSPSSSPTASPSATPSDSPTPSPSPTTSPSPTPASTTLLPGFLEDGSWTLNDVQFDPTFLLTFYGVTREEVLNDGGLLSFASGSSGEVGTWKLKVNGRSLTCSGTFGPGNTLDATSGDLSGLTVPYEGDTVSTLCGYSSTSDLAPFTITTKVSLRTGATTLTMQHVNGTILKWTRGGIVLPSIGPVQP